MQCRLFFWNEFCRFFCRSCKNVFDFQMKKWYNYYNLIRQTVEAEIKVVMLPQRVRAAESRMKYKPSNGPRRVQSNVGKKERAKREAGQSILQRGGIRQLPGIWRYPAKCMASKLWIKVAPRRSFVLDRRRILSRAFLVFSPVPYTFRNYQYGGTYHVI